MKIQGDSGNVYDIAFDPDRGRYTCTCPDFKYRGNRTGYPCKHILRANMPTPVRANGRKKRETFLPVISTIDSMLSDLGRYELAGSYRRECAYIKDLDVVILFHPGTRRLDELRERISLVGEILSGGESRIISLIHSEQVDFRIVPSEQCWGSMLAHCTGSKEENIRLRIKAKALGMTLNEYGLFNGDAKRIAGETEESIYASLGEAYKPPPRRTLGA